ncbi:MAG: 4-hydroxy-tetrahydrodipicolinate reductase, partial [Flammeovirgaceae bacterium]
EEQLLQFRGLADVAIEFTQPEAAIRNLMYCFEHKIPVVCGTTGWLEQAKEIEQACHERGGALLYSSNFSLGVNLFFKLNETLARLMKPYADYQVSIDETHHTQKKDAPSGTAITLAEGIIKNQPLKKNWILKSGESITHQPESIVIASHRRDPVPGTHMVNYCSSIDDIQITHTAHSRQGFALGAVLVAEWLKGKIGVFKMDDFLGF